MFTLKSCGHALLLGLCQTREDTWAPNGTCIRWAWPCWCIWDGPWFAETTLCREVLSCHRLQDCLYCVEIMRVLHTVRANATARGILTVNSSRWTIMTSCSSPLSEPRNCSYIQSAICVLVRCWFIEFRYLYIIRKIHIVIRNHNKQS